MACYKPLTAYRLNNGQIQFHDNGSGRPMQLPCGRCIGCRLTRSREWAMRCVHEAQLHDNNCFITLTYNAENYPPCQGLQKHHFRNFMKKLRHHVSPKKIKFYQCGEYGDKNLRPHYHAILFGYNFPDWVYLFDSEGGTPIYTSPTLERIWNKGFVTVGSCTYESAGYVARYCVKKINGKLAEIRDQKTGLKPYERYHLFTGERIKVWPEYSTMSRGGTNGRGLAYDWFNKYSDDIYPKDYTTINGIRMPSTRRYDEYLREIDKDMYDDIKAGRQLTMYNSSENSSQRLSARETVKLAQNKQLIRSL